MKRLLVFQHVAHELLGTLHPLLTSAGFKLSYVNFGSHPGAQPTLDGYHGLIVLGGPMSVNDTVRLPHLTTEMKSIEEALRRDLPVLGICLGAQLIAKTLGSSVYPNKEKEIGWYDVSPTAEAAGDPLLGVFRKTEKIFQWHGDTFDIPRDTLHLAFSALCAHQAFRYGTNVYGLQFHLEVDQPMIDRWLQVDENKKEIGALGGMIDLERIHRETLLHIERLQQLGDCVFTQFIQLFGGEQKTIRLPVR